MLDHVYLNNFGVFNSVYFENPVFGDHVLVVVELALREIKTPNKSSLSRNWSKYSSSLLNNVMLPKIVSKLDMLINL